MCRRPIPPEIDGFFTHLTQVEPYPPGVLRIPDAGAGRPLLPGIAFFPGGTGLWMADFVSQPSVFPVAGVMIIAKDFDSETAYHNTLSLMQQGTCDPCKRNKTWGTLIRFLKRFEIAPKACFFTNCFMGLRAGDKATGRFPGAGDARFVNRCREFMEVQLKTQKPRLVLTLGIEVPSRLAALSASCRVGPTSRVSVIWTALARSCITSNSRESVQLARLLHSRTRASVPPTSGTVRMGHSRATMPK